MNEIQPFIRCSRGEQTEPQDLPTCQEYSYQKRLPTLREVEAKIEEFYWPSPIYKAELDIFTDDEIEEKKQVYDDVEVEELIDALTDDDVCVILKHINSLKPNPIYIPIIEALNRERSRHRHY
ncbi:MAG: hypothetical protein WCQ49_02020 [Candidatus Saccharibacteria bacterium]